MTTQNAFKYFKIVTEPGVTALRDTNMLIGLPDQGCFVLRVWNQIVSGPLVAPARYIGIGQASARPVTGERSALDRNQSDQTRYALTMSANAISQDQF